MNYKTNLEEKDTILELRLAESFDDKLTDHEFDLLHPPDYQFQLEYIYFLFKLLTQILNQYEVGDVKEENFKHFYELFFDVISDLEKIIRYGCEISPDQLFLLFHILCKESLWDLPDLHKIKIKLLFILCSIIRDHPGLVEPFFKSVQFPVYVNLYEKPISGWDRELLQKILNSSETSGVILISFGIIDKIFNSLRNAINEIIPGDNKKIEETKDYIIHAFCVLKAISEHKSTDHDSLKSILTFLFSFLDLQIFNNQKGVTIKAIDCITSCVMRLQLIDFEQIIRPYIPYLINLIPDTDNRCRLYVVSLLYQLSRPDKRFLWDISFLTQLSDLAFKWEINSSEFYAYVDFIAEVLLYQSNLLFVQNGFLEIIFEKFSQSSIVAKSHIGRIFAVLTFPEYFLQNADFLISHRILNEFVEIVSTSVDKESLILILKGILSIISNLNDENSAFFLPDLCCDSFINFLNNVRDEDPEVTGLFSAILSSVMNLISPSEQ